MADSSPQKPEMDGATAVTGWRRSLVIGLQKGVYFLAVHWYALFMLFVLFFFVGAFFAPALMASGSSDTGQMLYRFYAPHNHQLPERSYFLFGTEAPFATYAIGTLIANGANPDNLPHFLGNATLGYKTALNHRMIAIFVGVLVSGFIWRLRPGQPRISLVGLLLTALPLIVDAFSHAMSENGSGFRSGSDLIGSLNWWLRALTGLLFGWGLVWYFLPRFADYFARVRARLQPRFGSN